MRLGQVCHMIHQFQEAELIGCWVNHLWFLGLTDSICSTISTLHSRSIDQIKLDQSILKSCSKDPSPLVILMCIWSTNSSNLNWSVCSSICSKTSKSIWKLSKSIKIAIWHKNTNARAFTTHALMKTKWTKMQWKHMFKWGKKTQDALNMRVIENS